MRGIATDNRHANTHADTTENHDDIHLSEQSHNHYSIGGLGNNQGKRLEKKITCVRTLFGCNKFWFIQIPVNIQH